MGDSEYIGSCRTSPVAATTTSVEAPWSVSSPDDLIHPGRNPSVVSGIQTRLAFGGNEKDERGSAASVDGEVDGRGVKRIVDRRSTMGVKDRGRPGR